jgi:hypothetical protein
MKTRQIKAAAKLPYFKGTDTFLLLSNGIFDNYIINFKRSSIKIRKAQFSGLKKKLPASNPPSRPFLFKKYIKSNSYMIEGSGMVFGKIDFAGQGVMSGWLLLAEKSGKRSGQERRIRNDVQCAEHRPDPHERF